MRSNDLDEVTTGEARRILGVCRQTLMLMLERGLLPYRRLPIGRLIPRSAVLDALAELDAKRAARVGVRQ